jgi:hypothetical protein
VFADESATLFADSNFTVPQAMKMKVEAFRDGQE